MEEPTPPRVVEGCGLLKLVGTPNGAAKVDPGGGSIQSCDNGAAVRDGEALDEAKSASRASKLVVPGRLDRSSEATAGDKWFDVLCDGGAKKGIIGGAPAAGGGTH